MCKAFPEINEVFVHLSHLVAEVTEDMALLERFTVLMFSRNSVLSRVKEARQ